MPDSRELAALAAHLRGRREAILEAWRQAVARDPKLTTGATLPRAQLTDHIPILLETFERRLDPELERRDPGGLKDPETIAAAHGLHRWQQGYDLLEVSRELGRLNECVVTELEAYAKGRPEVDNDVMAYARRLWAEVSSLESSSSIAEYFRLQQMEANGHISELQQALADLRELSRQRADLLHEAAHDIRDNMNVVLTATAALNKTEVAEVPHYNFLRILDRNVMSLEHLLDDVLEMTRLQAGKDRPKIAPLNVAQLLRELCEDMQGFAEQRGLELKSAGPSPFLVEGDATKIRRIAQNLVLNGTKHARRGCVTVSWGESDADDPKRWVVSIQDTGSGQTGGESPLTDALEEATDSAVSISGPKPVRLPSAHPGDGIGLSIVKRLAELLDASVEAHTDAAGTTFRVLLPRRYNS